MYLSSRAVLSSASVAILVVLPRRPTPSSRPRFIPERTGAGTIDSKKRRPLAAVGLSLAAGSLILLGGIVLGSNRETAGLAPLTLVSGAAVLVGGVLLFAVPRKHNAAGVAIIVASAAAFFTYGWLFLSGAGVVLGTAAGILAVQWESQPAVTPVAVH